MTPPLPRARPLRNRPAEERPCPRWASSATAALSDAGARIRVIAANTPVNLRDELARLEQTWRTSGAAAPSFTYEVPPDHGMLRAALEAIAAELDTHGELGEIYASRARELAEDAAVCEAAGTAGLWPAARRRYARRDRFDADADVTADAWLAEHPPRADGGAGADDPEPSVRSDDERSPASLISRLRQEIGRRRLPLRVVVKDNLASLAATGDGFVQVVAGRPLTQRDVERTVLHEIAGHVEPRVLRRRRASASSRWGRRGARTTRRAAPCSSSAPPASSTSAAAARSPSATSPPARSRPRPTSSPRRGSSSTVAPPWRAPSASPARAHRGGGLGREAVYLPALLRVDAALAADREIDRVLCAGRVAVDAAPVLRPWLD